MPDKNTLETIIKVINTISLSNDTSYWVFAIFLFLIIIATVINVQTELIRQRKNASATIDDAIADIKSRKVNRRKYYNEKLYADTIDKYIEEANSTHPNISLKSLFEPPEKKV